MLKIRMPLLNFLIELYEQCKSGHCQIIMLEGSEGTGKTHLAQIFLKWAAKQTTMVFSGRAALAEEHVPYHPLLDILQQWSNHEAIVPHLPTLPWAEELVRLMPALAGRYPDLSPPCEEDEETIHAHLAQAVAAQGSMIARTAPLVLCLDDIQWANVASLALLSSVVRHWQQCATPILLLLCLRSDLIQLRPAFASWHSLMQQSPLPTSILSLTPLTFQETIQFTRSLATERTTLTARQSEMIGRWLSSETHGNPLSLMETLRILLAHNFIELQQQIDSWAVHFEKLIKSSGRWLEVLPPGMYPLIRTRLSMLTPHAISFLRAAAIAECGLTLAHLCTLTGLSQQTGQEALEELLQEQHLASEADMTYYFTHECVRQIIWTQMSNRQRLHLHRRVLTLLQKEEAAPALMLRHAQTAQLYEQAFHSALAAGDEAMQLPVFQEAIAFYSQAEQALARLTKLTPDAARLPLSSIEHMYLQLACAYHYRHDEENVAAVYRSMIIRAKKLQATAMQRLAQNHLTAHIEQYER